MSLHPRGRREKILIKTIELEMLQIDSKIQIENLSKVDVEFSQTN